ncbi:MAG: MATE family efflux transporter [Oscillospiraceae bacterium]|nr:MATE family efflux transporter [Oscillospiraceae bacterium]
MEQTTTATTYLETEKIGKLMRKYSIPCIISMVVGALYNIVDQIFIANADYLGSYGNAANTVVYPITVLALGIAVMIGDGGAAYVGACLGRKDTDTARRTVGNAILLNVICGVALMCLYLLLSDPIITLCGGTVNEETYACAKEYYFWISLGIPFYIFGQGMNPLIRSDGSPKFAMAATVLGAVTNIILDPIMIYGLLGCPQMGMKGAAIATVAGQILTAALSVWYLCHMKVIKLNRKSFGLWGSLMKKFLTLGVTSFLTQIALVISMATVNNMCTKYGALDPIFSQNEYSQIPLAVLGIVMKFFGIAVSIGTGIAAGSIPVVSYNIGARRKDRARKLFTYLIAAELGVGVIALLIVELFPQALIGIFGAANESAYYTQFAVRCFRIYLCTMPLCMMNKGVFIYLQAIGKPVASISITMAREILFGVALPILLPRIWGLDGVLYSFPAADLLATCISVVVIVRTYKELSDKPKKEATA